MSPFWFLGRKKMPPLSFAFLRIILLVATVSLLYACDAKKVFAGDHGLSVGFFEKLPLHEGPSLLGALPRPFILYTYAKPEHSQTEFLTVAGIFNRASYDRTFSSEFRFLGEGEAAFIFFGDSPKDHGNDYNEDFQFHGHRLTGSLGPIYDSKIGNYPYSAKLLYRFDQYFYYSFTGKTNVLSRPSNFREHSGVLSIEAGPENAPSELFQKDGIRTKIYTQATQREGNRSWGKVGFERKVDSWLGASVGMGFVSKLTERISWVGHGSGSLISSVDRLNAFSDANFHQDFFGLLYDFKSKRAFSSDLGFKWANDEKDFGLKPFGLFTTYREVLVDRERNNWGSGAGLKTFGRFGQKFLWYFVYAIAWHLRTDKNPVQEIKFGSTYQFF